MVEKCTARNTAVVIRMNQYDLNEIIMAPCGPQSISFLIKNYHYLHSMPGGILKCFVLLESNNIIPIGGAVFGTGRWQYREKYIEFSRLWVDDRCPKNTESKFVSYCVKNLQIEFPLFEGIVSWSDPAQGHTGTLYKACNFIFDGNSRPTARYKNLRTGKLFHSRHYAKQGWIVPLPPNRPKKRFIYYFDKKKRELLRKEERYKREPLV